MEKFENKKIFENINFGDSNMYALMFGEWLNLYFKPNDNKNWVDDKGDEYTGLELYRIFFKISNKYIVNE